MHNKAYTHTNFRSSNISSSSRFLCQRSQIVTIHPSFRERSPGLCCVPRCFRRGLAAAPLRAWLCPASGARSGRERGTRCLARARRGRMAPGWWQAIAARAALWPRGSPGRPPPGPPESEAGKSKNTRETRENCKPTSASSKATTSHAVAPHQPQPLWRHDSTRIKAEVWCVSPKQSARAACLRRLSSLVTEGSTQ